MLDEKKGAESVDLECGERFVVRDGAGGFLGM